MYAVIGADGFLGSSLMKAILNNTDELILAVSRNGNFYGSDSKRVIPCIGDLCDKAYRYELIYKINSVCDTKVIFTAAVSDIDKTAENPNKAALVNIEALKQITEGLYSFDKLLFASSDTVYGEGGKYRFSETDEPRPLSVYGQQKLEGEKIVSAKGGTSLRLPLMFSESVSPCKKHFCDKLEENIKNGEDSFLVTDSIRSTLDYGTVAELIIKLCGVRDRLPDIINLCSDTAISKYELGLLLCRKYNAPDSMIIPVKSNGMYKDGAVRAKSTIMNNSLLKKILGIDKIEIKL